MSPLNSGLACDRRTTHLACHDNLSFSGGFGTFARKHADYERVIDAYRDLLRHQIRELEQQASREKTISMLERRLGCVAATWQDGSFEEVSMVGQVAPEPPA
jgi:hypothetical protein